MALKVVVFLAASVLLACGLWGVGLIVAVLIFGAETPECTDSDTCGMFGDIWYEFGDGYGAVALLLPLTAAFAWRFLQPFRR